MRDFVTTSGAVTSGHPDKLCDQMSDAVVDAYLSAGCRSGISAEAAIATGVVFLSVRSSASPPCDLASLARQVISEAGYEEATGREGGPTVILDLGPPLAPFPGRGDALLAEQMTTAIGYACDHTHNAMPLPISVAHRLTLALDAARLGNRLGWLSPDGQAQVAVRFENRRPVALPAIALSYAAGPDVPPEREAAEAFREEVIAPAFAGAAVRPDDTTRIVLLPVPGATGPEAHTGLTGRKTADDCYGGFARHSASALSGKDPSRIDRIAQYAARQAARAVVAAGIARECELELSYIPGDPDPVSIVVNCFGSGSVREAELAERLSGVFTFGVADIAERMGLWALPEARGGRFYHGLASHGHMGRDDLSPPWEDMAQAAALV